MDQKIPRVDNIEMSLPWGTESNQRPLTGQRRWQQHWNPVKVRLLIMVGIDKDLLGGATGPEAKL